MSDFPWAEIYKHFGADFAGAEPEPPAGPSAEDIAGMGMNEFGEQRAALNIRVAGDVFQADTSDPSGGLPDYRHPVHQVREPTAMDTWREERTAAGVPNLNDFGLPARTARSNPSPWSVA